MKEKNILITLFTAFLLCLVACNNGSKEPIHTHTAGTPVEENRKEPTCTTIGSYDSVTYCTECHEEMLRQHLSLPALGHDLIHHDGKTPTCVESGFAPYDTCSRCDYTTYKTLDPTGHVNTKIVEENRKEPTCTEDGSYDLVTYCDDCGAFISKETKTIDSLGHDYGEWKTISQPTETENGLKRRVCNRCSNVDEKIEYATGSLDKLAFDLLEDGTYQANAKNAYIEGNVVIPSHHDDIEVTRVCLSNCRYITSVSLPNTLKGLATECFMNCYLLTEIIIPNGVEWIGWGAFRGCSSITSIVIPNSVLHLGADYLNYTFSGCGKLSSVTLSESLEVIPYCTFYNCKSLEYIKIPRKVTKISTGVFDETGLKTVVLPKSLSKVREGAFIRCPLEKVFYEGNQTEWGSIDIEANNDRLVVYATTYFYSEEAPISSGNYWHYVNDTPTIW